MIDRATEVQDSERPLIDRPSVATKLAAHKLKALGVLFRAIVGNSAGGGFERNDLWYTIG
jgi:hypothetical protein